MTTMQILEQARAAAPEAAGLSTGRKNAALNALAEALEADAEYILEQNALDMAAAENSMSPAMLDRLRLDRARVCAMAEGISRLCALPDPVGRLLEERTLENGLKLKKVSVPLGVIAIIYESRPNVASDAAALCLKSGSACVLRGGREAYLSSRAIAAALRKGLRRAGLRESLISALEDPGREGANELMRARGYVDLLIPRGGAGLIRSCVENACVPVIETGVGICSIYVDADADIQKALDIIDNAKRQRPSVCNAAETLLISRTLAPRLLPLVKQRLNDVELRLCPEALSIIDGAPAQEQDFDTEFLGYTLAVKLVQDVNEAVRHIALHSTHHSDAIITENPTAADFFCAHVDSAAVYVNASTRFTDGGCFGLGCEMGISTQKLHARGPMGLAELTSYKYIITGNGQVRK